MNFISEFIICFEITYSISVVAINSDMHTVLHSGVDSSISPSKIVFGTDKVNTSGNNVFIFIHHWYEPVIDIQGSMISLKNTIGSSWDAMERHFENNVWTNSVLRCHVANIGNPIVEIR